MLSPTFTLVQTFDAETCSIWHFDLYRLENAAEIVETGLQEALDEGLSIIEWPEIVQEFLPNDRLMIQLRYNGDSRSATLQGLGSWQTRLKEIKVQA